jgi:oxalate decarboxylase/phosphoglucose isomerase-like protein (cupin superfamily)
MKVTLLKPNFKDARGIIADVMAGTMVDAITLITSKKGASRGNHYHKRTRQWVYVLSGKLRCLARTPGGKTLRRVVGPGALIENPPREQHTFVALKDSAFLSISAGPRRGKDYEKDTFRLDVALR